MRPVLPGDVFALANQLARWSADTWPERCERLFFEADCADKYRKRFHRLHPAWGNGSLMGRVMALSDHNGCSAHFGDPKFCGALAGSLTSLSDWRAFKAKCALGDHLF
jgi:hypothetical protein